MNYFKQTKNEFQFTFHFSGVTIGNGIDLKEKNRGYFEDMDVPANIIDKLQPYFGLQGQNAQNALNQNPLSLTEDEACQLSNRVIAYEVNRVKTLYNTAVGKCLQCIIWNNNII